MSNISLKFEARDKYVDDNTCAAGLVPVHR